MHRALCDLPWVAVVIAATIVPQFVALSGKKREHDYILLTSSYFLVYFNSPKAHWLDYRMHCVPVALHGNKTTCLMNE